MTSCEKRMYTDTNTESSFYLGHQLTFLKLSVYLVAGNFCGFFCSRKDVLC